MIKNEMRDVLIYAELGMYAFVAGFIMAVAVFSISPVYFAREMLDLGHLLRTLLGILVASPPLIFAWVTYQKLVRPLRKNKEPSKRWRAALEILGYFLGLFVGGIVLYIANRKINVILENSNKT